MGTIADKLSYLAETKGLIKDAIEFKNVDVPNGAKFRDYPELIRSIEGVSSAWATNIKMDKAANIVTVIGTVEGGETSGIVITLDDNGYPSEIENIGTSVIEVIPDENGYPTTIMTDGVACTVELTGFDEEG